MTGLRFPTLRPWPILRSAVALALATVIALIGETALSAQVGAALAAATVVAFGSWAEYLAGRRGVELAEQAAEATVQHTRSRLLSAQGASEELSARVASLWGSHVNTAKVQIEQAGSTLSARFWGINDQLSAANAAASATAGHVHGAEGVSALIEETGVRFGSVLQSLWQALHSRDQLLDQMRGVNGSADDLKRMAEEVAKIASQVDLLARNMAIEAARACDAGREISVVADEARALSNLTAEIATRICDKVDTIATAMAATLELAGNHASADKEIIARGEQAIAEMRAGFHQAADGLSASDATLLRESQGVQEEVTEVLVAMQYHDRVTQILNHVRGDIERLCRFFEGRRAERSSGLLPDAVDAEQWLAQMERGYTLPNRSRTTAAATGKSRKRQTT